MRVVWVSSAVLVLVLSLLTPSRTHSPVYVPNLPTLPSRTTTTTTNPTTTTTTTTTPTTTTTTTPPTTTTPTTTTTTPIGTDSSTSSSLSEVEVYRETKEELDLISEVLDNFANLISTRSGRSVRSAREHPAFWWQRVVVGGRPLVSGYEFCMTPGADDLCNTLEEQMERTDNRVADLRDDVNAWEESDLEELRQEREGLEVTYDRASDSSVDFAATVNKTEFILAIDDVKQDVQDCRDVVQEKIDELDPPDNPGSVALVATIGAIGGVMILGIFGVMIYSAAKQSKTKKKLSSGPKSKAKGENIPIDAYAQDAQAGPRAAPRVDPYSQPPAPAPQPHHYGPQYDPRRDPGFPDAMGGRPQRGLRRTNMI
ncbi:myotubularin-related protein DDB_G0290005-like [Eriocheir sinensis]|uniref:myotubularin-related protein DDB_G0290005-like n=1 Tax=Eriocheir sinensis TaxID=95602 RepID=UPI0021C77398|nr:myotubularin-related protein DDB_G0290005-like [Eriocheir sinensis]